MANFYDKASLVLIPSGTKEGTIFSQKPTNGDGDFTFSRSTSATRVGPSGYIEKETQNLLLQSNAFDTTWIPSNASLTSGQSGYDGNDAWFLQSDTANSGHRIRQTISVSGVYTFSVYAKAGGYNYLALYSSGALQGRYFNLSSGTIGNTMLGTPIDSKIESVGSGWYRCSVTFSATESSIEMWMSDSGSGYIFTGDGTSGVYIQDAQLEQGLVARDYIETTTSAVYGGITDNIPRLDYTDSSCPSLLLEPQRTNLVITSEYAGGSGWFIGSGYSVTHNAAISPEGVQNAFELTIPSTSQNVRAIVSVSPSTTYTFSFYIKRGSATELKYSIYNLTNNTDIIAETSYYSQTSATEWKRIEVTFTTPSGCTSAAVYIDRNSQGNGTAFFYGIQCEAGSYATSYIPTYGSAVTRNQDTNIVRQNRIDLIGQTEGTLFFEGNAEANSEIISINRSTSGSIFILSDANALVRFFGYYGGGVSINNGSGINTTTNFKAAFAYKSGDSALYVNGQQIAIRTEVFAPTISLQDIWIAQGNYAAGKNKVGAKQAIVFKTRLTNEELAALTTI